MFAARRPVWSAGRFFVVTQRRRIASAARITKCVWRRITAGQMFRGGFKVVRDKSVGRAAPRLDCVVTGGDGDTRLTAPRCRHDDGATTIEPGAVHRRACRGIPLPPHSHDRAARAATRQRLRDAMAHGAPQSIGMCLSCPSTVSARRERNTGKSICVYHVSEPCRRSSLRPYSAGY